MVGITLSAWVSDSPFWIPCSRKCRRSNEWYSCSTWRSSSWQLLWHWQSSWNKTMQWFNHMPMENGRDITYRSTLASSSLLSVFWLVGCHISISKYLTRKGHTTLSRTKYKKYLPHRVINKNWYKRDNVYNDNNKHKSDNDMVHAIMTIIGIIDINNIIVIIQIIAIMDIIYSICHNR